MAIEYAEKLRRIPVYPAADGYASEGPIAKLASNESPYPPIPAVIEAVTKALTGLNRYPDPTNAALRRKLSDRTGVPAQRIAIGNGSCDILLAAGDALLEPGAELVYAWPSFSVYPHLAAASGRARDRGPARRQALPPARQDGRGDHRRHAAGDRLQPEQPDLDRAAAGRDRGVRASACPRHVAVILDEAYIEFNVLQDPDESVELLDKHPNLVLLRTFSKVYGLCGLRVGYALCGSEGFRTAVDQVRQPFFCNAAAQAAALEALNHQDEVTRRVERNLAERIGLEDGLRELGIEPAESQANFVWFDLGRGARRGRRHARPGRARDPRARRRGARAARARCASRSARRPRTSASWKLWPRCCNLAPRAMAPTPAITASSAGSGRSVVPTRIPPGDLARRSAGVSVRRRITGPRAERRSSPLVVPFPARTSPGVRR